MTLSGVKGVSKYYADGRLVSESTGAKNQKQAERFLKAREGRIALGQPLMPRAERVRYEEIADDLKRYYETTGKRHWREVKARFDHLRHFFGGWRVASIGPAEVARYMSGSPSCGDDRSNPWLADAE